MNKYAIGENIYRLLKQRRMTQHELAARIGVQDPTLSRWMTGQRQPSAYALLRISRVLGVTMESLMKGVDNVVSDYRKGTLAYFVVNKVTGEVKGEFDCEQWANEFAKELNREMLDK